MVTARSPGTAPDIDGGAPRADVVRMPVILGPAITADNLSASATIALSHSYESLLSITEIAVSNAVSSASDKPSAFVSAAFAAATNAAATVSTAASAA